jgi:hypothetical protein
VDFSGVHVIKSIGASAVAFVCFVSAASAQERNTTTVSGGLQQAIRNENNPLGGPSGTTVAGQSHDGRWQAIFNEDTRYYWWRSTLGFAHGPAFPPTSNPLTINSFSKELVPLPALALPSGFPAPAPHGSGSLLYAPIAFQLTGRPIDEIKTEFLLRGGAANGTQTTPLMSGQVATQVDTSVTEKVTYLGFAGVQPFASVSINMPTGRTVLFGNSAFARMDPDLVELATYGEGWNVGPTVGVNIPLTQTLITSFGLGYTLRGAYYREDTFDPTSLTQGVIRLGPGNVSTANATIAYRNGGFVIQGSGSYSMETVTTVDHQPFTKAGDRYLASIAMGNAWTDYLSTTITGIYSHSLRNKVVDPSVGDLVVEAFNSNSDLFKAVLDVTVKQNAWSVGPTGSYLFRNNNSWNSTAMEFLPAKTRYSAGGTAGYAVTNTFNLNARVERIWIKENANPDKLIAITDSVCPICTEQGALPFTAIVPGSGVPSVTSTGWLFSLAATAQF